MSRIIKILLLILLVTAGSSIAADLVSIEQAAIEKLRSQFELDTSVYEIEILSNQLTSSHIVPEHMSFRPLTQTDPLGLYTVLAELTVDKEVLETGQIRFRVSRFEDVLTVTGKINRSGRLDPSLLTVQRMNTTDLREQPIYSQDEIVGYRAKRNLRQGMILTYSTIEKIPEVDSGAETLIVFDNGACRITAPGVALETGYMGDLIRVRNSATKKVVVARVTKENQVKVDP